jgi:4'-phosphopantetheinyl transferase
MLDERWLDEEERTRAARFVQQLHSERYVRFHAATRLVLSLYTGVPPERIEYRKPEPGAKPALASGQVQFNLSHTGDSAVLAVSAEPVGVDIEQIRPITDLRVLAARVFSSGELSRFMKIYDSRRQQSAFFSCWSRKEAILKEMGTGLSLDPSLLTVGWGAPVVEDVRGTWRLQRVRGLSPRITGWVASRGKAKLTNMSVFQAPDSCQPAGPGIVRV